MAMEVTKIVAGLEILNEPPGIAGIAENGFARALAALALGAAEILGLPPTTLHSRMKKLGITRPKP